MKTYPKLISLLMLSALSTSSFAAGDEAVNCGDKIVDYKPVYGGLAQCDAEYTVTTCKPTANGFDLITTNKTAYLIEDITKHDKPTVRLSKFITYSESYGAGPGACTLPQDTNEWVHCSADLDYLGEEPVKEYSCDYTPKATIQDYYIDAGNGQYVVGKKAVKFTASDRDGSVAKKEAWINGTQVSFGNQFLETGFHNVKIKVTDNDGHVTETSRIVSVSDLPICYDSSGVPKVCESEM